MVEFYDPVEKKNISYHIDKKLVVKWDALRNTLIKKDEDRVYIVDGRERVGKSVFTFQQAKYIDPTFSQERVCFTPEELLNAIRTVPKGSAVVFDEGFRGLSSKATQSRVNKKIVQGLMEMGQKNLVVFIVLPTIFLLEMYAAVLRSEVLFHIFKDKKGKRAWRLYNHSKKTQLYLTGKKKGFSYKFPKVHLTGRFFAIYAINEKIYRKQKMDSLKESDKEQLSVREERYLDFYRKLICAFKDSHKLSEQGTADALKEYDIEISPTNVGKIYRKLRKYHPPPAT